MTTDDKLRLEFDDGSIKIFWDDRELTKSAGGYTSILVDNMWYDSKRAIWNVKKKISEVCAIGKWHDIPISQKWVFKKDKNKIHWTIRMDIEDKLKVKHCQTNLMLSRDYNYWTDSATKVGIPKPIYEWKNLWSGHPYLRYIGVLGRQLPNVFFSIKEGQWYDIANIQDTPQGRINLQFCYRSSDIPIILREKSVKYFEGIIHIKDKPFYNKSNVTKFNYFYNTNFPRKETNQIDDYMKLKDKVPLMENLLSGQLPSEIAEIVVHNFRSLVPNLNVRYNYLGYFLWRHEKTTYYLSIIKLVANEVDFKNKKILDLGCGVGSFANFLYTNGIDVVGFDIIKNPIKVGLAEGKVPLLLARGENIPFKDGTFDIILLFDMIEHLWKEKSQEEALLEMNRVLKDDGMIILTAPNRLWPWDEEVFLFGVRFLPRELADWYVRFRGASTYVEDRNGGFNFRMRTYHGYKNLFTKTGFYLSKVENLGGSCWGIPEPFCKALNIVCNNSKMLFPAFVFLLKKST